VELNPISQADARGGVKHVWPNRGPHTKGSPFLALILTNSDPNLNPSTRRRLTPSPNRPSQHTLSCHISTVSRVPENCVLRQRRARAYFPKRAPFRQNLALLGTLLTTQLTIPMH